MDLTSELPSIPNKSSQEPAASTFVSEANNLLSASTSTLINQLNQTLLARQYRTAEDIAISHVCGRTPQFNKHVKQEQQDNLVPVATKVLNEFTKERDDVCVTKKRRNRKVLKKVDDIFEDFHVESDSDLVSKLRIIDMNTSSKNFPYPEILNCIFTKYFQRSKYVIKHAQDFLTKYLFFHFGEKGCHREQLMDLI